MGLWHVLSSMHAPRLQQHGCKPHGGGDLSWLMQAAGAVLSINDTNSQCRRNPALPKLHSTASRATCQLQPLPTAHLHQLQATPEQQPGSQPPHLDSTLLQSPTLAV